MNGIKDPKQTLAKSGTLDSVLTPAKKMTYSERSSSLQIEPQSVLSESSTGSEENDLNEIDEEEEEEIKDNFEMEDEMIARTYSNLSIDESKKETPEQNARILRRSDQSLFPDLSDDVLRKKIFTELDRINKDEC